MCLVGHKLHRFFDSFHYHREYQGKCSHFIQLNTLFLQFDLFHFFDALTFIFQYIIILFSFSMLSHSYHNFNFEVTLFVVETIIIVNAVRQVVMFILIQSFRFMCINTTMHAHTIGYYCYCHHYFTVFSFAGNKLHHLVDSFHHRH